MTTMRPPSIAIVSQLRHKVTNAGEGNMKLEENTEELTRGNETKDSADFKVEYPEKSHMEETIGDDTARVSRMEMTVT